MWKAGVPKDTPRTIEYRSFKRFDESVFIQDLNNVPWHIVDNESNVKDAVLTWNRLFTEVADSHATLKKRRVKGTPAPWMNNKIAEAILDRNYHASSESTEIKLYIPLGNVQKAAKFCEL